MNFYISRIKKCNINIDFISGAALGPLTYLMERSLVMKDKCVDTADIQEPHRGRIKLYTVPNNMSACYRIKL